MLKALRYLLWLLPIPVSAQSWSGILDPTRAARWDLSGAYQNPNTLPNWSVCTLTDGVNGYYTNVAGKGTTVNLVSGSGNSATNRTRTLAALSACHTANPTGTVVLLPASTPGTEFYMDGLCVPNYTVLRGAGADQTMMHATTGGFCGGGVLASWVGANGPDNASGGYMPSAPTHSVTWVGTTEGGAGVYSQNATHLILQGAAPVAGQFFVTDQLTDAKPADPTTWDEWLICAECANQASSDQYMRPGRALSQWFQVVGNPVNNGDGTYTVTVTPPVRAPSWRSAKTPQAWWGNPNTMIHDVGVEDFSVNATDMSGLYNVIGFVYYYDVWAKGIRIYHNAAQQDFMLARYGTRATFESNYLYLKTSASSMSYGFLTMNADANVIQNNVCQQIASCWVNASEGGNVFAYNYAILDYYSGAWRQISDFSSHTVGSHMNLDEGNIAVAWTCDDIEGTGANMTVFRSNFIGIEPGKSQPLSPMMTYGGNRYMNFVGNVLGAPGAYFTKYQTYNDSEKNYTIFVVGLNAGGGDFTDPLAINTSMFWGNWDTYNKTTLWNSSDVPTTANLAAVSLTKYPNAVPADHILPASFYLSSQPRWWRFPSATASSPWPAIGPDVTGGNVGNCSGTFAPNRAVKSAQCSGGTLSDPSSGTAAYAGHVWANPAFNMYLNVMGGAPDGSGQPWGTAPPNGTPLSFNASGYYAASGTPPSITTASLPSGTVGVAYSQPLTATGDTPITWDEAVAGLSGCNLNLAPNGAITGTPVSPSTCNFTARASNAAGNNAKALSIQIESAGPVFGTRQEGAAVKR